MNTRRIYESINKEIFIMDDGRIDNINSSINCFESVLYNTLRLEL